MLDRVQTLLRLLGQAFEVGHHQVGIGLVVAAPHAAAQLVQLGQSKLVRAAHDDGVGTRHINAGFNDGGTQEQVVALGDKVAHHTFQLPLGHLPMGHRNACLGQQLFKLGAPVLNRLHLVVQKVDLAAALEFAQHRLADHAIALGAHKGLDRQASLWRGGNHTQVTQAFKRHAQRARYGRGGERQHIHLGAQRFHGFFVAHAKAVLFVNDQEPQVFEMRVLAQQLVGAHHDVNRAVCHTFECGGDFFAGAKAAHLRHFDWPFAESIHQGLVVLLRQQRGGCQQCHLLATGNRNKCGAQGHFGFAKAHVAAYQPVHGARADHVLDHRVNGGFLVRCFFKAKVVGKGFVVGG